ncbi:ATP-dependent dethiobiotin synthetase BioD [Bosea sp. 62]|uniref:dethiobiotin synthase n=1 Tax=unclassified Bosea (in: a-proteobacteria) TaxID=2653178 RepID=UPI00125C9573|nr:MULTISPECIES: dethiobiotin synthase [unclassified Bosea (in: a-proteobacteria)]CAD5249130.1 ATP-dependent dethiobiotin synthetase BioD [Bosea sp. 46]CAD5250142.1 ATP-dependent dethiobiotin synthetase BioD [Bosea sp. 21B]CAD5265545.1 ATP-dependent dethiobiotin synthetase BioD [Bosea sp. 7B]VVT44541.1 ATP-dependent dethiobiotin synthetase BioD [Bosea sp. EC-HK365B]VXB07341.1 ATP-dependent dethiobiotin synthetase BioD [Bosea sp. 29B]
MNQVIVIAGTDTGIGKTVFAAALSNHLGACYWKPIQSGLDGETDSEAVVRLGGVPADHLVPEAYRLRTPASPHHAAMIDGVAIDVERLSVPRLTAPLIIEGAGGLMVPLTDRRTFLDLFAHWRRPVVLCARTQLGTINHTLLSLDALRRRSVPVLGVAFIGHAQPETERIIGKMGEVRILGRLPWLESLDAASLKAAFQTAFAGAGFERRG